jgi:small neutral amino acid transporter SnatA (MarC family)
MYFLVLEILSGSVLAALAVQLMVNGLEDLPIIAVCVH